MSDINNVINAFQQAMDEIANEETKQWFENYLKGVIEYRGLKTPQVTKLLADIYKNQTKQWSLEKQIELATSLLKQKKAEDKFAGSLYLQKYLIKKAEPEYLLNTFEDVFKAKAFWDWSTNDWFSVRVLDPMIMQHGMPIAERIASWHIATDLWQRRSAIVAFRHASKYAEYHELINSIMSVLIKEQERFIQTGVGWVLSDMSKQFPDKAAQFVENNFADISPEVIRRHTKYLPDYKEYKARLVKSK